MNDTAIIAIGAAVTSIAAIVKQIVDNKQIRKWICTREPCDNRIKDTSK